MDNVKLAVLGVDGKRNKAGTSFVAKGVRFARPEVPVWLEARETSQQDFAHLLGKARLSVHDDVLWADCDLLDDRLPGSLLPILYPHACGTVDKSHGDIVEVMTVTGINISTDTPLDERIANLVTQGVKARKKG